MRNDSETQNPLNSSEEQSRFPLLSVLRMLWKRRALILTVWLAMSVLAIMIVRALPSVYQAEAVVLVDSQKIPENLVSPTVSGDVADRLALITQNIMTSARLLGIITHFHLYQKERPRSTQEELLRKMRDDISVSFEKSWTGGRMRAFRLGYQGQNAQVVTAVTNRLASLYVEENVRAREDQAEGTVDFLRRQLQEAKKSLDEQEQKVAQFKQEHNGSLPEQQNSLLGMLNSLSAQLEGVRAAISRTQEDKLSLEAALSAAESSEAALRASLQHPSSVSLTDSGLTPTAKSEILKERLQQLRLRYSSEYPAVQMLEQQIAEAKREESDEADITERKNDTKPKQRPTIISPELLRLTERITTLRSEIAVANHKADSLEKERQQLTASISDCQARINKLPLVEQEMAALKRNYEESANNYKSLLQKQLAAGIATDMEKSQKSERFTVIDAARIPETPVQPNRPMLMTLGIVAGLVIGLLTGFLLEFRKQTFMGEWELPAGTLVLGRVPLIQMAAIADSIES